MIKNRKLYKEMWCTLLKITCGKPWVYKEWEESQSMTKKPVKITLPGPVIITGSTVSKSHCRMTSPLTISRMCLFEDTKGSQCYELTRFSRWPTNLVSYLYFILHGSYLASHSPRWSLRSRPCSRGWDRLKFYLNKQWSLRNRYCSKRCGNINKFCLLRGDHKFWHTFYNGGLWENIWKHK